jgi:predicted HTH transcriptional regulator
VEGQNGFVVYGWHRQSDYIYYIRLQTTKHANRYRPVRTGGQRDASGKKQTDERRIDILQFLASNPEQAYTPKEIHEATEVTRNSVGVVLSRLENRGLVRHRGEYWAIAEGEEM